MSPGREGDISKCPVMMGKGGSSAGGGSGLLGIFGGGSAAKPADASAKPPEAAAAGGCPVRGLPGGPPGAASSEPEIVNEYGEKVNPLNQMPAGNQEPWPGQKAALSTERVMSDIPKSDGTGETWTYPSPQQFYNALKRKGKGADVSEDQVDTLVAIHNNMNDVTWHMLLDWEKYHIQRGDVDGDAPRLAKFMGRPFDLTPKARIKSWLGYGLPFDRHDWEVDRGQGKGTSRYVIDYYYDNSKSDDDSVPDIGMRAKASDIQSIVVDVRPALDSLESVYHRFRRFPARAYESFQRGRPQEPDMDGPGTGYETEAKQKKDYIAGLAAAAVSGGNVAAAAAGGAGLDPETAALQEQVEGKCGALFGAVSAAEDDEERAQSTMALHYCVSTVVCPPAATAFMAALERADVSESEVETANLAVSSCVEGFLSKCRNAGLASGLTAASPIEGVTLRSDVASR